MALLLLLAAGAVRFVLSGLLPAVTGLRGDFAAVFPSEYFARLRPEWPPPTVWGAAGPGDPDLAGIWYYGPMTHFVTIPLFAAPSQAAVAPAWAAVNTLALIVSFLLVLRMARRRGVAPRVVGLLAALWMGFQPLAYALGQGNIEIVELAVLLGGLTALVHGRGVAAGGLVASATMIKYLPAGFLVWLALRSRWRPLAGAAAAVAVIVLATAATLGWENSSTMRRVPGRMLDPPAGFHEVSITSAFLHRAAVLDADARGGLAWESAERRQRALRAGLLASALLGLGYATIMWRRRRTPLEAPEIAVLFVLMVLLPPWNHDYYYLFTIVPLSMVVLTALEGSRRQHGALAAALVAYALISPPVPFSLIDRLGWFDLPFMHVWNFADMPVYGGLLLLAVSTYQWLAPSDRASRRASTTLATSSSDSSG